MNPWVKFSHWADAVHLRYQNKEKVERCRHCALLIERSGDDVDQLQLGLSHLREYGLWSQIATSTKIGKYAVVSFCAVGQHKYFSRQNQHKRCPAFQPRYPDIGTSDAVNIYLAMSANKLSNRVWILTVLAVVVGVLALATELELL